MKPCKVFQFSLEHLINGELAGGKAGKMGKARNYALSPHCSCRMQMMKESGFFASLFFSVSWGMLGRETEIVFCKSTVYLHSVRGVFKVCAKCLSWDSW